jgi:hypothetical protein
MSTKEALAIAGQKPRRGAQKSRAKMDKLLATRADQLAVDVSALAKRFERMGDQAAGIQKQLDEAKRGIAIVEAANNHNYGRIH